MLSHHVFYWKMKASHVIDFALCVYITGFCVRHFAHIRKFSVYVESPTLSELTNSTQCLRSRNRETFTRVNKASRLRTCCNARYYIHNTLKAFSP